MPRRMNVDRWEHVERPTGGNYQLDVYFEDR